MVFKVTIHINYRCNKVLLLCKMLRQNENNYYTLIKPKCDSFPFKYGSHAFGLKLSIKEDRHQIDMFLDLQNCRQLQSYLESNPERIMRT